MVGLSMISRQRKQRTTAVLENGSDVFAITNAVNRVWSLLSICSPKRRLFRIIPIIPRFTLDDV